MQACQVRQQIIQTKKTKKVLFGAYIYEAV